MTRTSEEQSRIKMYLTFQDKFASASRELIHTIGDLIEQGTRPNRQYSYPVVSKDGKFSTIRDAYTQESPISYRSVIIDDPIMEPFSGIMRFQFVKELVDFCRSENTLFEYFSNPRMLVKDPRFYVCNLLISFVDHYLHISNGAFAIREKIFEQLIRKIMRGIAMNPLPIWVLVPLPYTNFSRNRIKINSRMCIIKLSDRLQKMRYGNVDNASGAGKNTVYSANYGVLIKGWTWNGNDNFNNTDHLTFRYSYGIEEFDRIFSILRLCWDHPIGFGQIVVIPRRWAHGFKADLIDAYGTSIRRYPTAMDELNPYTDEYSVDISNIKQASELFGALENYDDNRLEVALRRYSISLLRDSREDSIIDAAIGIEALMSDDKQEISHKIALRIAALSQLDPNETRTKPEVFRAVKKFYDLRSAIVHGGRPRKAKKAPTVGELPTDKPDPLATGILRQLLVTLLRNPHLRNPQDVDEKLLLGAGRDAAP